jgi:hypothetical protein
MIKIKNYEKYQELYKRVNESENVTKDIQFYKTLLLELAKNLKKEEMKQIFQDMEKASIQFDKQSYYDIYNKEEFKKVNFLKRESEMKKKMDVIKEVEKSEIKILNRKLFNKAYWKRVESGFYEKKKAKKEKLQKKFSTGDKSEIKVSSNYTRNSVIKQKLKKKFKTYLPSEDDYKKEKKKFLDIFKNEKPKVPKIDKKETIDNEKKNFVLKKI